MARVLRRTSTSASAPPEEPLTEPAPRHTVRTIALAAWMLLLVAAAVAIGYDGLSAAHLFPGTTIGGVVVGSRSLTEAQAMLTERVVKPLQTTPVTVRAHETLRASAWAMGLRMDVRKAVQAAYDEQRSTSLGARLWRRAFGDVQTYRLRGEIDEQRVRSFVADIAGRVNREPKDATVVVKGETLDVVPHQVGRRLDVDKAGAHLSRALRAGDTDIRLPVEITQPALRTEQFNKVILVRTQTNRLDLYLEGKVSKSYPVATGTPGYPTPRGQFHITAKRRNPTWGNPWAEWSMNMPAFIGPGPNNPLGTRAMNLSAGGIRIHGTPDADSIGGPASHGCIRMYMHDAEELFDIVDVGTPVVVVGA